VEGRATLKTLLPCILILAASTEAGLAQSGVVPTPDDLNTCILCHSTPEFWTGDKARLYVPQSGLVGDVHYQKGLQCHDCHGGNPRSLDPAMAHSTRAEDTQAGDRPFQPFGEMTKSCGACHTGQYAGLVDGVHGETAGQQRQARKPVTCNACHGDKPHAIVPVSDPTSPVNAKNQVRVCGECHAQELEEYSRSGHGFGLFRSGLKSAVCADCHGAHGIYTATNQQSTLHSTNVAGTCAACHRFVKDLLAESVHGRGNGLGGITEEPAPGGEIKRRPSCTDCHVGHDLPDPRTAAFRLQLPGRCGTCHVEISRGYKMSLHGALTDLGYEPGAKCSDCHGGHDILPLSDPRSPLAAGENRLATCRSCHPNAVPNFCNFLPHADYHDAESHPILHFVFLSMELLIYSVFIFFGLHSLMWFARSLWHVRRHGRPRRMAAGDKVYVRFEGQHRLLHAVVAISFLGLALTGLPLKYSSQPWAQKLVYVLGGFESTSVWHRICGVVTILYFACHLVWLAIRIWNRRKQGTRWMTLVLGPDSPVPNPRDFTDILGMFRWFVGMGPKPTFERWTYWEKFDYWAVFWGVGIIGTSGLLLWFPNLFSLLLPGEALNVAKIVHSEEALLATSFIFAIHFFGTHLRPEKFPIDMSVLSGLVSEEEMLEERLDWVQRMQQEQSLDERETVLKSPRQLYPVAIIGFIGLAVGLCLLAGILAAIFSA
jgi:cytochrome b subunit of formate dehydrogenase